MKIVFCANGLFTGRIRIELILEQWDELLRLAASLKRGWIVPSVLLARMSTDQRPDRTAKALGLAPATAPDYDRPMSSDVGVAETPSHEARRQQGGARGAPKQQGGARGAPQGISLPAPYLQHSLPPLPGVAAAVLARSPADDQPSLDLVIPDSVAPEELGLEPIEGAPEADPYAGAQENWSLDGLLQRALDRRLQRKAADTAVLCPRYNGYDRSKDVGKYNCAGLAWRTYDFRGNLANERAAVEAGTSGKKPGNLKLWFWEYDLHLETDDGRRGPENHDFHMVGGIIDKAGADPDDVYTKNGARPVFGPSTGPSHKPKTRDRAMSNDPSNTPQSLPDGTPLFKVRSNFKEIVKCHPCPK